MEPKVSLTLPDAATSEPVQYGKGLSQGHPESSPQFDDVMETIMSPLVDYWDNDAFILPESKTAIPFTRIADNIYLFARGFKEAETMLSDLYLALFLEGIVINEKSRKFMAFGTLSSMMYTLAAWGNPCLAWT